MSLGGYTTRSELDFDDVVARSSTWTGGTVCRQIASHHEGIQSDTKCYGGRFTYGQWRRFFAFRVERSPSVLDARAREGPTHFSWQRPFVEFFRPEIWLLILLHSDAAAMGRLASCCWAHARLYLPWQRRGVKREDPLCEPEMHVAQLAARLRCGLPWAEELLDLEEISPPVGSWLELLYQQEAQGAWLCLVCTGHRGELVRNFCAAVALAEQRPDPDCPVIIALLPSVQHVHVTAGSRVCIQKALKILGLPLPYLSGGDFELRSRWQSPAIPKGGRRYLPTLSLQSLEVRLDGGCVELQNCVLYGHGTTEDSPRGVGDCVLRVSSGTCLLADCQVRLRKGHAGFGVVVGPDIVFPFGMRPHAMIKRTEVVHATTACLCFMGGQLTIEEGCILRDCRIGVSVCDQGSIAFIVDSLRMSCREGGQKFEQVFGGIITRPAFSPLARMA
ncbi:unnamed protein product [Effrenium voratum]|uniref:Uncharacterized protein n=1 Tax=Effrenium voratum TaxID=2562239 RepID=A0AA36IKP1_9DINO|nr:unnamed protein product [Effrenium voratum]CAJ1388509.1 unnamed protein product [Effrenium voratum]